MGNYNSFSRVRHTFAFSCKCVSALFCHSRDRIWLWKGLTPLMSRRRLIEKAAQALKGDDTFSVVGTREVAIDLYSGDITSVDRVRRRRIFVDKLRAIPPKPIAAPGNWRGGQGV